MSEPLDLAASIRANTAAVQALTAAFLQSINSGAVPKAAVLVVPKVDVAQARRELQDAAAEDEAFAAVKPVVEQAPVTLDEVKKAATTLAKKDREALAALVAKYESDKVVNIRPIFYAAFQRDVAEALA
jgi:hypothetical protein